MDYYDIKRLALILATQSTIEGMKAENLMRVQHGDSLAYTEGAFEVRTVELEHLAYKHNDEL